MHAERGGPMRIERARHVQGPLLHPVRPIGLADRVGRREHAGPRIQHGHRRLFFRHALRGTADRDRIRQHARPCHFLLAVLHDHRAAFFRKIQYATIVRHQFAVRLIRARPDHQGGEPGQIEQRKFSSLNEGDRNAELAQVLRDVVPYALHVRHAQRRRHGDVHRLQIQRRRPVQSNGPDMRILDRRESFRVLRQRRHGDDTELVPTGKRVGTGLELAADAQKQFFLLAGVERQ